jgi:hypothetical protein
MALGCEPLTIVTLELPPQSRHVKQSVAAWPGNTLVHPSPCSNSRSSTVVSSSITDYARGESLPVQTLSTQCRPTGPVIVNIAPCVQCAYGWEAAQAKEETFRGQRRILEEGWAQKWAQ